MAADLRSSFMAEYAKSGRSSCKKCKNPISQGVLRIGEVAPNPWAAGTMMASYYHLDCIFKVLETRASKKGGHLITDEDDVDHFYDLLDKDQARLKKRIEALQEYIAKHGIDLDSLAAQATTTTSSGSAAAPKSGASIPHDEEGLPERFMVEYAKTGRSTCRGCEQTLRQGELRLGQPTKNFYSGQGGWMWAYTHPRCFWKPQGRLKAPHIAVELTDPAQQLEGWDTLDPADQAELVALCKKHRDHFAEAPRVYMEMELVDHDGYDKTAFWEMAVAGKFTRARYGRQGSNGVAQTKRHEDAREARAYAVKAAQGKLKKYTVKKGRIEDLEKPSPSAGTKRKQPESGDEDEEDEEESGDDQDEGKDDGSDSEESEDEDAKGKKKGGAAEKGAGAKKPVAEKKTAEKKSATPAAKRQKKPQSASEAGAKPAGTAEDLGKLKVTELRQMCKDLGVCSSGSKAELVQKLAN